MIHKESFLISPTHIAYISGSTTVTWHEIGLSGDVKSIETVDGESGQVVCTRTSSSAIDTEINTLAYTSQIPTTTSQLTNDSGFITASALSGYATEDYVDSQIGSINTILDNINGEVI